MPFGKVARISGSDPDIPDGTLIRIHRYFESVYPCFRIPLEGDLHPARMTPLHSVRGKLNLHPGGEEDPGSLGVQAIQPDTGHLHLPAQIDPGIQIIPSEPQPASVLVIPGAQSPIGESDSATPGIEGARR